MYLPQADIRYLPLEDIMPETMCICLSLLNILNILNIFNLLNSLNILNILNFLNFLNIPNHLNILNILFGSASVRFGLCSVRPLFGSGSLYKK